MINVGKVCMKIAGRDAGEICVIIKIIDDNFVIIDGATRRRKCNINHLEILKKEVSISEDASNADVVKALKEINIEVAEKGETKSKDKVKPTKTKKGKAATEKPKATKKATKKKAAKPKATKKEESKEEEKPAKEE